MSGEPQNGSQHYDVIVVGLGAMGSAALYQLSKHDARVLGIDQFDPPHDRGSSHGETRLTRLGIGEGRHYVPFAIRSHEIWRELEAATGEKLLTVTGGLFFSGEEQGSPVHGAADFIGETVAAAQAFDIEHEVLDHQQLNERFPQFRYSGRERGYYEPDAGFVAPEKCIEVQLRCAQKMGAEVRTHEPVHRVEPLSDGTARVLTESGAYTAQRVILSAGSWLSRFLPPIHHDKFKVYRQSLYWIEVEGSIEEFHPERFPVFIRTDRLRDDVLYGFPANDGPHGGIKIATEYYDSTCNPRFRRRAATDARVQLSFLESRSPMHPRNILFVHGDSRRRVRDRSPSRSLSADSGIPLFWTWIQALCRGGRAARRDGARPTL